MIPALAFLFANRGSQSTNESAPNSPLSTFVLLLIVLGVLLIIGPDFLYLQDNFGYRINTVFKFYYQAWILLSLASAYGTAVLLRPFDFGSQKSFDLRSGRAALRTSFSASSSSWSWSSG